MEIKITAIHFNADSKLEEFISEKVKKLTQFDENLSSSDVHLGLEKPAGKNYDSKIVKMKVMTRGYEYYAEKKSDSFEAATNEAVNAIETQVKKRKQKIMKKK